MTLWERFRRLTVWNKLAVVGGVASILGFLLPLIPRTSRSSSVPVNFQPQIVQAPVLNVSPLVTPAAPTAPAPPAAEGSSQGTSGPLATPPSISQTMLNSPGGIQAAGDVTVVQEPTVLRTLQLNLAFEEATERREPSGPATDAGLRSSVALFTSERKRVRFVSDWLVHDQQVQPEVRRLWFQYGPEEPRDILGTDVRELADFEVLAINMSEIFGIQNFAQGSSPVRLELSVLANGVEVIRHVETIPPKAGLSLGQVNLAVGDVFAAGPAKYLRATTQ